MTSPLKTGLIGVGGVGSIHLECITAMERDKHVQLVAVADTAGQKLISKKQELAARGVNWYADHEALLNNEKHLDAVVIATPIPYHYEIARRAIERGLYVLLEKPPVPLIQDLQALIDLDRNSRVAMGFQMICSREVQMVKNWILEGTLGDITEIRMSACWPRLDSYYSRAGWAGKMLFQGRPTFDGPATNGLAHLIHSAMFFAGSGDSVFDAPVKVQGEYYRVRPIDGYDLACFKGQFASGINFVVLLTHATQEWTPARIEVRGSLDWARISTDGTRVGNGTTLESSSGLVTSFNSDCADPFTLLYRDFIDFTHGRKERPATRLSDTRGYVLTTNGALVSSQGIHSVSSEFVRVYEHQKEYGFDIPGLASAMDQCFHEGLILSELDLPWTWKSKAIPLPEFAWIDFAGYCEKEEGVAGKYFQMSPAGSARD